MHELADGIDITKSAIDIATGLSPSITATKNESCAVLELFPRNPGIYRGISHLNELLKLPSLTYHSIKAKNGTHIGKAGDGFKMAAVVILHHKDPKVFEQDLAYINANVAIMTD
jgi:hypothetical protein